MNPVATTFPNTRSYASDPPSKVGDDSGAATGMSSALKWALVGVGVLILAVVIVVPVVILTGKSSSSDGTMSPNGTPPVPTVSMKPTITPSVQNGTLSPNVTTTNAPSNSPGSNTNPPSGPTTTAAPGATTAPSSSIPPGASTSPPSPTTTNAPGQSQAPSATTVAPAGGTSAPTPTTTQPTTATTAPTTATPAGTNVPVPTLPPATLPPVLVAPPTNTLTTPVAAALKIDGSASEYSAVIGNATAEAPIVSELSRVMNVATSQVNLLNILPGSVIFNFEVTPNAQVDTSTLLSRMKAIEKSPDTQNILGKKLTGVSGIGYQTGVEQELTFQNGQYQYSSGVDVGINNQYAAMWNDFKGLTSLVGPHTVGVTADGTYRMLLRFDNLWLPSGSTVTSAKLRLWYNSWSCFGSLQGGYLKVPFNKSSSKLGFKYRDDDIQWGTYGATNDTDALWSGNNFSAPCSTAGGDSKVEFTLLRGIVQSWISNSSSNYGVILSMKTSATRSVVQFYSSLLTEMQYRPTLVVTFKREPFDPSKGVPDTPYSAQVSVESATSLMVRWSVPAAFSGINTSSWYVVQYSVSQQFTTTESINTTNTSAIINNLNTNVRYWVRVQAGNVFGGSAFIGTNPLFAIPAGLPTAPSVTMTSTSPTSIFLKWTPPTSDGGSPILGYSIIAYDANGFKTSMIAQDTSREYALVGLPARSRLRVVVSAVNNAGTGASFSAEAFLNFVAPSQPLNVAVVPLSSKSLEVSWEAPRFDGGLAITNYTVSLLDGQGATVLKNLVTSSESVSSKYKTIFTNVVMSTALTVSMLAMNPVGSSQPVGSSPATITLSDTYDVQTTYFQNGRLGYSSTREVVISTQYADTYNEFNGVTYGQTVTQYTSMNGRGTIQDQRAEEFRTLLRFDDITSRIPKNAVVSRARLVLSFEMWAAPAIVQGWYLNPTWNFNHTQTAPNNQYRRVGWRYRNSTHLWLQPGALGDTHPGSSFTLELNEDTAVTIREVNLDPSIITKWIANPETENNGVILVMTTAGKKAGMYSVTDPKNTNLYPMLVVTYMVPKDATAKLPSLTASPYTGVNLSPSFRNIYIDAATGDDMNNGDVLQPLATLRFAVEYARPGDIIYARNGVYAGSVDVSRPNITITSAPGEWAVIASPIYNPAIAIVIHVRENAHNFRLLNIEVTGGYYFALATWTTFDYYSKEESERKGYGPNNLLVENCKIHDTGHSAIKLKMLTSNARISKCEIYNSGVRSATAGHAFEIVNAFGVVIEDNYIHDIRGAGVKMSGGCRDMTVTRNYMSNLYLCGALLGFYEETEYMNWVSNRAWYECIRCKATSNIIVNVEGCGIGVYAAKDTIVAHNTLYSVAQSMMTPILINGVQHWENNTAQGSPITSTMNVTIVNNIAVKSLLSRKGMHVQIREVASWGTDGVKPGLVGDLTMENNVYFWQAESSGSTFMWGHGVMLEDERKASYFVGNVSGWQINKGWDVGSIEADPLLYWNYRLPACSPAAGKGKQYLNLVEKDYDGNLFILSSQQNVDVGAVQSGSLSIKPFPPLPDITSRKGYVIPANPDFLSRVFTPIWPYDILFTRNLSTYYVSPSGSDSTSTGDINAPYKTIKAALNVMLPGDVVYILNGTYTEPIRIQMPNITISAAPGHFPKIQVSSSDSSIANAVFFADSGSGNYGGSGESTIRGLDISGGYYYTVMFNQAGGGNTNAYWEWYKRKSGRPSPGITLIEDCVFHDAGSNVVKISPEANNIVFRRVEVYNSGKRVVSTTTNPGATNPEGQPNTTQTLDASTLTLLNQGNGFDIRNGNNIVIQDCYIHDISGTAILLGGGSQNGVIERNLITNIDGIGILVGSYNTEAMYMRLKENPNLYQAVNTIVRNNIVSKCNGAGIGFYSAQGAYAVHNTFIDVANTMHAAVLFNIAPNYVNATSQILPQCTNITFVNNIVTQGPDAVGYMWENRVWTSETPISVPFTSPAKSCGETDAPSPRNVATVYTASTTSGPLGKCPNFPKQHPINQDISAYPIHPRNDLLMKSLISKKLHPDFGGFLDTVKGPVLSGFGISYVNKSVPKIPVQFLMYPDESDAGPYPIPINGPIEGATGM